MGEKIVSSSYLGNSYFCVSLFDHPNQRTTMAMHPHLTDRLIEFIQRQHLFFTGTAGVDGTVNVSPKGLDTFHVAGPNRVLWLNLTGSGNETAAHVLEQNRITVMFCSFDQDPLILRLYGQAAIHHAGDPEWDKWIETFPPLSGTRQIFDVTIDRVQTSCGFGVPQYTCLLYTSPSPRDS